MLAAVCMIMMLGMLALGLDLGYMAFVKTQLQRNADAAAHAAMVEFTNPQYAGNPTQARQRAVEEGVAIAGEDGNVVAGVNYQMRGVDIQFGSRVWDGQSGSFSYTFPDFVNVNCIRAIARRDDDALQGRLPFFFAPIFGINDTELACESIVAVNPRDIVIVIDLSGSMHHDSEPWSWAVQNWLGSKDGIGAGDQIRMDLWDDMGLTAAGVNYSNMDAGTSENKRNNNYDSNNRDNNKQIGLNNLNFSVNGQNVQLSASESRSIMTGGSVTKTISGRTATFSLYSGSMSTSAISTSGTNLMGRMNFSDVRTLMTQRLRVNYNGSNSYVDTLSAMGNMPNGTSYDSRYGNISSSDMAAYDFITDNYLASADGSGVMQDANPPPSAALTDTRVRNYYRGYLSYTRNYSPTSSSSGGILSWANPTTSDGNSTNQSMYNSYSTDSGQEWSGSFAAEASKMANVANYKTYIQFMMDMGFNMKVGKNDSGNYAGHSNSLYTPMSSRFIDDGGSPSHAYRRYDSNLGKYRPIREQPTAGMADAIIAALTQLRNDNTDYLPALRDKVAVLIFHSSFTAVTGANGVTFLDPVDDYDTLVDAVITKASQALPNGTSNVDGTAGSTNTMWGLRNARQWIETQHNNGRQFSNKQVYLFTDGVPNTTSSPESLASGEYNTYIDMDLNGSKETRYHYNSTSSDARTSALHEVYELYNAKVTDPADPGAIGKALNTTVHTITAGAGQDSDITARMSRLTSGTTNNSGRLFNDYATKLLQDFRNLAGRRAISFAIDPSTTH